MVKKRNQTKPYRYHLLNHKDFKDLPETTQLYFKTKVEAIPIMKRELFRKLKKERTRLIKLPENQTIRQSKQEEEDKAIEDEFNRILCP